MVIGIDIDDTITNTTVVCQKYLQIYAKNYSDYHKLPYKKYEEFLHKYIKDIHLEAPLQSGIEKAFAYFKSIGSKIVIITARNNKYNPDIINDTIFYLNKYGLSYDKIIFDEEASNKKGLKAYEAHVDIFIDDKESNLDDINKYGIKCLRYTTDLKSKYPTFSNWEDIITYFKNKEV